MSTVSSSVAAKASPLSFRVFDPHGNGGGPAEKLFTLREAFLAHHQPDFEGQPSTLKEYVRALNHWEKHTDNLPVQSIDIEQTAKLRRGMRSAGCRPATIRKTWRHLRAIFTSLVDLRLIDIPPKMRLPKVQRKDPRETSYQKLGMLYEAADVVQITRGIGSKLPGPQLFRTAFALFLSAGLRRDDGWGLLRKDLDLDHAEFTCTPKKTRNKITRKLTPWAVTFLRLWLQQLPADEPRVFPIAMRTVHRWWDRIREAAGIKDVTWQDFRRTCQTRYDDLYMGLGDWQLDHKKGDVGSEYYRNMRRKSRQKSKRFPIPKAFRVGLVVPVVETPDPQKRLF